MAEVIKQQPKVTEGLTQEALTKSGYNVGAGFIKAISDKVSVLVRGLTEYKLNERFKSSGFFGVAKDAVQALFRKPKQPPIVQDTIEKASLPKQTTSPSIVQDTIEKVASPTQSVEEKANKSGLTQEDIKSLSSRKTVIDLDQTSEEQDKLKEEKLIETEEKARIVLIGGITEPGLKNLKEKLPELFEEIFKKLPKTEQQPQDTKSKFSEKGLLGMLPKGLLAMGGGLALLLGGLAALVAGLQTDGPFKGLLKIFSKTGLMGGLKLLEKGAKTFLKGLSSVIKAPVGLLRSVARGIGTIFGPGVYKKVLQTIKATKGLFVKILGGLVKILKPILSKLPLVGTVISWGFAYTRFKSGDVVGGTIDILSGLANLLYFTPLAPLAIPLMVGLDILNAFLDYKTGGATKEASAKKGSILKDWAKGIGSWFAKNAENFPIIGPLIKTGRLISESKWAEALASVVEWIPGVSWVLDWLGFTSEKRTKDIQTGLSNIKDTVSSFMTWINESVGNKISSFFTGIFDGAKNYWDNLSLDPRSWFGKAPEPSAPDTVPKKSARGRNVPKMAEGGVVTDSNITEAVVGEAGDEAIIPLAKGGVVATQPTITPIDQLNNQAVVPLEKYFNGEDFTLSKDTLEKIASNTGSTSDGLKVLGQAILKLAQVFSDKSTTGSSNIVINGQQQNQTPSASQVAATNVDPIRAIRAQFAI